MITSQISAVLRHAQLTAQLSNRVAEHVSINAVMITPNGQYQTLGVDGMMIAADFVAKRSETMQIKVKLQPGIYFDKILPYRDSITCQLIVSAGKTRKLWNLVAVPLLDRDIRTENNNSVQNNIGAMDHVNLVGYDFQLIDAGFAKLRNLPVSNIYPVANIRDVLISVLDEGTRAAELTGYDAYKGISLYEPVDNVNSFRQIIFPSGTRLVDAAQYLQTHNEYGVYSKGLGSFYKQNHWWVYPLFNFERVKTHARPLNIIRVPENKIPDLDSTFYVTPTAFTIIAAGKGSHSDSADIRKQNQGVGKRIVMGDAIAGDTGYHYNAGRALTTRADSMQEYKLSDRRDGNEWIPLDLEPTGNVMLGLSQTARNQGELLEVEWRNGDTGYLEPGHPLTYQYFRDDEQTYVRRGVLLGYRTDYVPVTAGLNPSFKRTTILTIFLRAQDQYSEQP